MTYISLAVETIMFLGLGQFLSNYWLVNDDTWHMHTS